MYSRHQLRRISAIIVLLLALAVPVSQQIAPDLFTNDEATRSTSSKTVEANLDELVVKGRAPKTGYSREQFGSGWDTVNGCDMRERILQRDLKNETLDKDGCTVLTGVLNDPYTAKTIQFHRGRLTSSDIQIDHVVALSDAWQSGAQQFTRAKREKLANDPLELIAVDGRANQQKSDGDAATWLPSNKSFRCQYIKRQISVKKKYDLWVKPAEKRAMAGILAGC